MIDVSEAFDDDTTVECFLTQPPVGTWNENNQWVEGKLGEAESFWATPIPAGDLGSAVFGESLEARKQGERAPEYMKFHSTTEMPINSFIKHGKKTFKVIRLGDLGDAGYYVVTGAKILGET